MTPTSFLFNASVAALLAASTAVCATPGAAAQIEASQVQGFAIPAQPLGAALNAWSRQADMQVFYPSDVIAGRTSPAIDGQMSPRDALDRLLAGSGLVIASEEADFVSLRAAPAAQPATATPARSAPVDAPASIRNPPDVILVTAQRREQAMSDVPFALTAFSGDDIEALGAQTLRDISLYTPGLLVEDQSPNNPIFVMRGITSSGGDAFTEPRVSVFQDGVPISKSRGSFVELFDIERIEIAKGPQSTLFGRGALIGGINVIQNTAGDETDWAVSAEAGSFDGRQIEAMGNLPIADGIALRLAGRHRERDGYMENLAPDAGGDLNGTDLSAVRAVLSLTPNDRMSADIFVNYQEDSTNGTGFKSMYFSPTDPQTGAVLAGLETDDPVWLSVPAGFADSRPLGVEQDYTGVTGRFDFALNDDWTLEAITGYRDVNSVEVYDADGISLPLFTNMEDNGGEFFSQEVRLSFDNSGAITGFAGANYYRERARSEVDVRFDERMLLAQVAGMLHGGPATGFAASTPAPEALFANTAFTGMLVQGVTAQLSGGNIILSGADAAALAAQLDPGHVETSRNLSETDSYDVFADITLRPTDRLEINAGVRYTRDDKTTSWASLVEGRSVIGGIAGAAGLAASGDPVGIATAQALLTGLTYYGTDLSAPLPAFGVNAQPTANNGDLVSDTLEDDGFTWRLAARYDLTETLNLYGSYARGRRPAVLSAAAPGTPGGLPGFTVAPAETADTYEIGLKLDAPERGLRLDGALYFYDYQNFQTRELIGSGFVTTNAGEAEAYGVELQGSWQPVEALTLFGTYAYNHTRFQRGAYEGNSFARSPDHMVSLGAVVTTPAPAGHLEFRPNYTWRSDIFFADDNDRPELQTGRIVPDLIQDEYQDAFGLFNLRVAYIPDDGNWDVEAFVNNASDEVYRKGAGSAGESIGMPTNVLGDPRIWGVRVSIRR